jgi:nucleoside-diphosphate kinase
MAVEQTLSIIKPGAVRRNLIGQIIGRFESSGLRIAAARMLQLDEEQAARFYAIHRERPFYSQLIAYMTEGPILVMVLEGEDAIARNRAIMGSTDPQKAMPGTIRFDLGKNTTRNTVHGSDAPETAATEIAFFFKPSELCPRHG